MGLEIIGSTKFGKQGETVTSKEYTSFHDSPDWELVTQTDSGNTSLSGDTLSADGDGSGSELTVDFVYKGTMKNFLVIDTSADGTTNYDPKIELSVPGIGSIERRASGDSIASSSGIQFCVGYDTENLLWKGHGFVYFDGVERKTFSSSQSSPYDVVVRLTVNLRSTSITSVFSEMTLDRVLVG